MSSRPAHTRSTLDLFVAGNVASAGLLSVGNPNAPDALRIYVGGSDKVGIGAAGHTELYGSLYAPSAVVGYVGDAHIVGSIFAKTIVGAGLLTVDYGAAGAHPNSCTPSDDPGAGPVFF